MEKLERMYNKVLKALNIDSLKNVEKSVKNIYDECGVPEDQMFKVPTKWEWIKDTSIMGNIHILIDRNICEYVAKKSGYLKNGYTFKDGGVDSNEDYTILLNSPEDCTKEVVEDVEFNGDTYHINFKIKD